MKLRRYYIEKDGMKYIGENLSLLSMSELILETNISSIKIEVEEQEIMLLKEQYAPLIISGNIPEGRKNFVKWLKNPFYEIENLENFDKEEVARLLSEIFNASSASIIFISGGKEIKFKVYSKDRIEFERKRENSYTEIFSQQLQYYEVYGNKFIITSFETVSGEQKYLLLDLPEDENEIDIPAYINHSLVQYYTNFCANKVSNFLKLLRKNVIYCLQNLNLDLEIDDLNRCYEELINITLPINSFSNSLVSKIFQAGKPSLKNFSIDKIETIFQKIKPFLSLGDYEWEEIIDGKKVKIKWDDATSTISTDAEICPSCGSLIEPNNVWTTPSGQKLCPGCAKKRMRELENSRMLSYHTRTIFNPMASCGSKPSEKTRYGFELEMILNERKGSSSFYNEWLPKWYETVAPIMYSNGNLAKLERDGSLGNNGEEMISQPLNKDFILGPKMKELLSACKELYHSESCCGLHFHIDKNALTSAEWGKLIRFFTSHYNDFVEAKIFRPTNHYNDLQYLRRYCNAIDDDERLFKTLCDSSSHYSSISISSHTGKTVEFRCFDSTVEVEKFINNIKTIMMLMDNVDKLNDNLKVSFKK